MVNELKDYSSADFDNSRLPYYINKDSALARTENPSLDNLQSFLLRYQNELDSGPY